MSNNSIIKKKNKFKIFAQDTYKLCIKNRLITKNKINMFFYILISVR